MNPKDLKTTIMGVIGAIVIVLGIFWPDKIDPETQVVINGAVSQVVTGVGALITLITGLVAKDK